MSTWGKLKILYVKLHGVVVDHMSEFKLVTMTETTVVVRHEGEGHEFSFRIVLDSGEGARRVLPDEQVRGLGIHQAQLFLADATSFAQEQVNAAFQH